jgi:hypothetical protein
MFQFNHKKAKTMCNNGQIIFYQIIDAVDHQRKMQNLFKTTK